MTTKTPQNFMVGSWAYSQAHWESVRILNVETVWNHTVYQVWIPRLARNSFSRLVFGLGNSLIRFSGSSCSR